MKDIDSLLYSVKNLANENGNKLLVSELENWQINRKIRLMLYKRMDTSMIFRFKCRIKIYFNLNIGIGKEEHSLLKETMLIKTYFKILK